MNAERRVIVLVTKERVMSKLVGRFLKDNSGATAVVFPGEETMTKRIIAYVCAGVCTGYLIQAGIGVVFGVVWAFATHPLHLQPYVDFIVR